MAEKNCPCIIQSSVYFSLQHNKCLSLAFVSSRVIQRLLIDINYFKGVDWTLNCNQSKSNKRCYLKTFQFIKTFEPSQDKTNKMTCAPSEASDQPGHPPSLIGVFTVHSTVVKGPLFLHADSEGSDQTGRMLRLICRCWAHRSFCSFCHAATQL